MPDIRLWLEWMGECRVYRSLSSAHQSVFPNLCATSTSRNHGFHSPPTTTSSQTFTIRVSFNYTPSHAACGILIVLCVQHDVSYRNSRELKSNSVNLYMTCNTQREANSHTVQRTTNKCGAYLVYANHAGAAAAGYLWAYGTPEYYGARLTPHTTRDSERSARVLDTWCWCICGDVVCWGYASFARVSHLIGFAYILGQRVCRGIIHLSLHMLHTLQQNSLFMHIVYCVPYRIANIIYPRRCRAWPSPCQWW